MAASRLLAVLLLQSQNKPEQIAGATSFIYRTINGTPLRLHVFTPPYHNAEQSAAIVFFLGGGWHFGTVWQFVPQAQYLAQRGMVAIVADYRVLCRHGTQPSEAMEDAKAAISWIRSHASTLGIDPARIAGGGGSAGGHLAVSTQLFESPDASAQKKVAHRLNALVLFNPGLDITLQRDITASSGMDAAAARAISPLHHLRKRLPPTLILQGRADTQTPYVAAVEFCRKATALGSECDLVGYEGAEHGFFNAPDRGLPQNPDNPQRKAPSDHYRQTLFQTDQFLTRLGYFNQPTTKSAGLN